MASGGAGLFFETNFDFSENLNVSGFQIFTRMSDFIENNFAS